MDPLIPSHPATGTAFGYILRCAAIMGDVRSRDAAPKGKAAIIVAKQRDGAE